MVLLGKVDLTSNRLACKRLGRLQALIQVILVRVVRINPTHPDCLLLRLEWMLPKRRHIDCKMHIGVMKR